MHIAHGLNLTKMRPAVFIHVADDDAQRLQGAIQFRRVDAVPVAENEPVGLLTRDDLSKLLDRPSWRMVGHVEVSNLACSTSMITNT